jgi:hypothetical protein
VKWAQGTPWSERLVGAVLVLAGLSVEARAEPDAAQKALATKLFNDGKQLMAEGRTAEACAKLGESQRLDPAPGTILNLAVCHEKQGRTATAWAEYRDARLAALRDGRADRVTFADQHARALEPRLSHLKVSVPAGADLPGLSIRRDGGTLPRDAWDTPLPVDPGEHVVEASAADRTPLRVRVQVRPDGDLAEVVITPLAEAPPPPPVPALVPAPRVEATGEPQSRHGRRNAAIALAAEGVVSSGAATYFALRAIDKRNEANPWCPFASCTPRGATLNDSAKLSADLATVGFALGVTSLAAAGYLAWTGRSAHGAKTGATLVPALAARGETFGIVGFF